MSAGEQPLNFRNKPYLQQHITEDNRNLGSIYQIIDNHYGGTAVKNIRGNSRSNVANAPLVQTTKVVRIPLVTAQIV
jgi:hypothetical protein